MTPSAQPATSKIRLAVMTVTPALLALMFLSAWQVQHYTKQVQDARNQALQQATSAERESFQLLEQCWALNGTTRQDSAADNARCLSGMDSEQQRRAQHLNQDMIQKMRAVPAPFAIRLLGGAP